MVADFRRVRASIKWEIAVKEGPLKEANSVGCRRRLGTRDASDMLEKSRGREEGGGKRISDQEP